MQTVNVVYPGSCGDDIVTVSVNTSAMADLQNEKSGLAKAKDYRGNSREFIYSEQQVKGKKEMRRATDVFTSFVVASYN